MGQNERRFMRVVSVGQPPNEFREAALASLSPDDARHREREPGKAYIGMADSGMQPGDPHALVIRQIDRPISIRRMDALLVPCDCGKPLVGVSVALLQDAAGWSLHAEGVCLACGIQRAFYVSEPVAAAPDARRQAIRAEIEQIEHLTDQVMELSGPIFDEAGRYIAPPQRVPVARPSGPWDANGGPECLRGGGERP